MLFQESKITAAETGFVEAIMRRKCLCDCASGSCLFNVTVTRTKSKLNTWGQTGLDSNPTSENY